MLVALPLKNNNTSSSVSDTYFVREKSESIIPIALLHWSTGIHISKNEPLIVTILHSTVDLCVNKTLFLTLILQ
jgi:hypothetical protein